MSMDAILREVDQLNSVSTHLEELADHHPKMTKALVTVAESVRSTATVLAVLVAIEGPKATQQRSTHSSP
jgi:hypothetical protein